MVSCPLLMITLLIYLGFFAFGVLCFLGIFLLILYLGLSIFISTVTISLLLAVFYYLSITPIFSKNYYITLGFLLIFSVISFKFNSLFITAEFSQHYPNFSGKDVLCIDACIAMVLNRLFLGGYKSSFNDIISKIKNLILLKDIKLYDIIKRFFIWIFIIFILVSVSYLLGLNFSRDTIEELLMSVFARVPLAMFFIKIPLGYINGWISNNPGHRITISIGISDILVITVLSLISNYLVIPYLYMVIEGINLNDLIKILGISLKTIAHLTPFKGVRDIGKSLMYYSDKRVESSLPVFRYKFIFITAEHALALAKVKHWSFWKSIPKIPSKDCIIIPNTSSYSLDVNSDVNFKDTGKFDLNSFLKVLYYLNKNRIFKHSVVPSENTLELEKIKPVLITFDIQNSSEPLIKFDIQNISEQCTLYKSKENINNFSLYTNKNSAELEYILGLSKNKQIHIEYLYNNNFPDINHNLTVYMSTGNNTEGLPFDPVREDATTHTEILENYLRNAMNNGKKTLGDAKVFFITQYANTNEEVELSKILQCVRHENSNWFNNNRGKRLSNIYISNLLPNLAGLRKSYNFDAYTIK